MAIVYCTGIILWRWPCWRWEISRFLQLIKFVLGVYLVHMNFVQVAHKYYDVLPMNLEELAQSVILGVYIFVSLPIMREPYLGKIVTCCDPDHDPRKY